MMNALNINQIKTKKANTFKSRCQKQIKITNFFRVFEILLVVAVFTRVSFLLSQQAFKISNEYLQSLSLILVSRQFMFVLGNAIVITLLANNGKFNDGTRPETSYINYEQNKTTTAKLQPRKQGKTGEFPLMAVMLPVSKEYRRNKSERLRMENFEKGSFEFRRSKTDIKSFKWRSCASVAGCCKETGEDHYPEDHMSNEEFKKTIEEFIARKQRFLRQEEEFSALDCHLG